MPEIKVRKADGTLATTIIDKEFVESLHNNWKAQMDMNGYNADGTKKEDGYFTQEEEKQYTQEIMRMYKPIVKNVYDLLVAIKKRNCRNKCAKGAYREDEKDTDIV